MTAYLCAGIVLNRDLFKLVRTSVAFYELIRLICLDLQWEFEGLRRERNR